MALRAMKTAVLARPPESAIARRQVLLRVLALAGVTAAAGACRHLSVPADTDAQEYDSMQITPPTAAGGGAM